MAVAVLIADEADGLLNVLNARDERLSFPPILSR